MVKVTTTIPVQLFLGIALFFLAIYLGRKAAEATPAGNGPFADGLATFGAMVVTTVSFLILSAYPFPDSIFSSFERRVSGISGVVALLLALVVVWKFHSCGPSEKKVKVWAWQMAAGFVLLVAARRIPFLMTGVRQMHEWIFTAGNWVMDLILDLLNTPFNF